MTQPSTSLPAHPGYRPPAWWAYLWWAVTGAVLVFGVVSLLTIGIFVLPIAAALGMAGLLWSPLRNQSVLAGVGGLAAAPLALAWLNRGGPGTVCETNGDVTTCSDEWSPWPFLAVAAVLIAVSLVGIVRTRRAGTVSTATGTEPSVSPTAP